MNVNRHLHIDGWVEHETVDHGDGTGTRTTYDHVGDVVTTHSVELPVAELPPPAASPEQVVVAVIREEIDTRLAPSTVNSIAEVKQAIREGLDAASERLAGTPG